MKEFFVFISGVVDCPKGVLHAAGMPTDSKKKRRHK
jgi:hypothetical protein